MKEVLHKIFSITMARLLLLSTISWKVEKHYCMGRLMDVALFVDVANCGMDMASMDDGALDGIEKKSCCDDEVFVVDGQDDLKLSFNNLDTKQQFFLIAHTYLYLRIFKIQKEQPVPNEKYPPPLLVKDIHSLDQVYLI